MAIIRGLKMLTYYFMKERLRLIKKYSWERMKAVLRELENVRRCPQRWYSSILSLSKKFTLISDANNIKPKEKGLLGRSRTAI